MLYKTITSVILLFNFFLTFADVKKFYKPDPVRFDEFFDHVFFITIKSPKRYNNIKRILSIMKTKNYSIIGINGSEVIAHPDHPMQRLVDNDFKGKYTSTELGCALSHRLVYELVSSGSYKHALIVQDNVHVKVQLFLELVQRYRKFIKSSWQIIHWHTE